VILYVILGADGTVEQIQIISGHPLLTQSVIDAVRQWRYKPTLIDGAPVEVETQVSIEFHN
jgi:protein TonB